MGSHRQDCPPAAVALSAVIVLVIVSLGTGGWLHLASGLAAIGVGAVGLHLERAR
ncbi:MAG: hypothetical protein H6739_04770 [Alphaproteobacteria bacterium]|nr:hypothetical protein [Alphaproteobacteria bacterium]